MRNKSAESNNNTRKRYGSEQDVESLTGFSRRTLQRDRLLGRKRFPYYKVLGKILYDLDEIELIIKSSLVRLSGDVAA